MNNRIKMIIGLSLMIIVLILVIQNANPVVIGVFFWSIPISGAMLFFLLFLAGAIAGASVFSLYLHHEDKVQESSK